MLAIAGAVYLAWWFMVELLLPSSFNPLPGRLLVVSSFWVLLAASYRSRFVVSHLSTLFTAAACLLVAHYCYLVVGNHGESSWWVGTFVTFAATSMCVQSRREVAVFSVVALGVAIVAAVLTTHLKDSIYVPGLATILLLANITKHNQVVAHDATVAAARAREERLQLAAIVESSGDAIVACDLGGLVSSWNAGAERLFGHTAAEMLGRPLTLLLPAELVEEERRLIARVAPGKPVPPLDTVRLRKDKSTVPISLMLSPIVDAGGQLVGVSHIARDISAQKRAELEMRRARETAEAANRQLEAFSYSVAHDLRSPLRGIDGFSLALLEDYDDKLDGTGRDYLRRVRESAQHMGRLIDGLLELGRVSRTQVHDERVDLSELARRALSHLQSGQPERRVEVVIQDGLVARGDSALLTAVLDNLLGNAWKFTRNTPNARIEFGITTERGQAVYFVRDNGAGFDMAHAAKLFGVFQRLHRQSEFEGTGVGLATVQRILTRHGGSIRAESKRNEGACFFFTLGDE